MSANKNESSWAVFSPVIVALYIASFFLPTLANQHHEATGWDVFYSLAFDNMYLPLTLPVAAINIPFIIGLICVFAGKWNLARLLGIGAAVMASVAVIAMYVTSPKNLEFRLGVFVWVLALGLLAYAACARRK